MASKMLTSSGEGEEPRVNLASWWQFILRSHLLCPSATSPECHLSRVQEGEGGGI